MGIGKGKHAVVVGAGLCGSLAAVMLARRGYRVTVLERRGDLRKLAGSAGRSINLALSTRGIRALAAVGLDQAVLATTLPMAGRRMHALDGTLSFQPYGQPGQAIRSVSRRLLNETLLDAAEAEPAVALRFGCRVEDLDLDAPAVVVQGEDGGEERIEADLILGADGIFSAVRGRLMRQDRFDYEQLYLEHGYKELELQPTAGGDFAMDPGALHIWPRRDYMLIGLPNQDRTFTMTLFARWEGPDSFAEAGEGAHAAAWFAERFPDAAALLPDLQEQWLRNPTSSLATIRCHPFHHGGKVALIGDAAHAVVPFYGQGMNAAFESARLLVETLDAHDGDTDAALPAFTARRKADADAIRQLALDNFVEMRANVADPRFLLRRRLGRLLEAEAGEHFRPLYSLVTFSNLPYDLALRLGRARERWLDGFLGAEGAAPPDDAALSALARRLAEQLRDGSAPAAVRNPDEEMGASEPGGATQERP